MRNSRFVLTFVVASLCGLAVACTKESTPTTPTTTEGVATSVTAPSLDAPSANQQLDTLRPTLVVRNATSDQQGTRTYEFQVSDSASFASTTTSHIPGFAATTSQTGVAEGTDGKTRWTPPQDLAADDRLSLACAGHPGDVHGPMVGDRDVPFETGGVQSRRGALRSADRR